MHRLPCLDRPKGERQARGFTKCLLIVRKNLGLRQLFEEGIGPAGGHERSLVGFDRRGKRCDSNWNPGGRLLQHREPVPRGVEPVQDHCGHAFHERKPERGISFAALAKVLSIKKEKRHWFESPG